MPRYGLLAIVAAFAAHAGTGGPPDSLTDNPAAPDSLYSGAASLPSPQDVPYAPGAIDLQVDATDVERRIVVVHESIPVKPGPLTLLYPEWLPGTHAPRGPIDALAGLTLTAGGRTLDWLRDPLNVYAFHVDVPAAATRLEVDFQFASALLREQGRTSITPEIVGLQWNTVLLYPAGYFATRIGMVATLTIPDGWDLGTALEIDTRRGPVIRFKPVSLDTLVDSPVLAGRYFKSIDLDPGAKQPVHLDLVADTPESLEARPERVAPHRKLIQEAYALLGPPHYERYEFLLALSDHFGEIGLEHHRSSEDRRAPGYFSEWDKQIAGRNLLPHELAHSWNGKFRRPVGLATPDFNVPMQNTLLWVYEGLTNYFDQVLSARAGLWSEEFARQSWANAAANMDRNRPGRAWRDLEDTTDQPIITPRRPLSWLSWQRAEDYYTEGQLIWLDVDTQVRELTNDRRTLDDFARAFFGIDPGSLGPKTYTFADIVRSLKSVVAFDWETFLVQRLRGRGVGAPLDGLTRGGWKLVFTEASTEYGRSLEEQRKAIDFIYSLGFNVAVQTSQLTEVRWGSPAYDASLTLGTTLIAVNGREYRPERLKEAIAAAKADKKPIELLVKNLDRYRTVRMAYYDGLKYPRLERIRSTPDRLTSILKPRT
ncbi:MAG TPA: hypothetical protein VJQ47_06400 [Steroidobacteraceae bacterium]|nr:hypothetical protein [Steroidobacteraceae bacterium]